MSNRAAPVSGPACAGNRAVLLGALPHVDQCVEPADHSADMSSGSAANTASITMRKNATRSRRYPQRTGAAPSRGG